MNIVITMDTVHTTSLMFAKYEDHTNLRTDGENNESTQYSLKQNCVKSAQYFTAKPHTKCIVLEVIRKS